jgi:hypothetical protein
MTYLLFPRKNKLAGVHFPTCEGDFSSRIKRKCDCAFTAGHDINLVFAKVYNHFSLLSACAVQKFHIKLSTSACHSQSSVPGGIVMG